MRTNGWRGIGQQRITSLPLPALPLPSIAATTRVGVAAHKSNNIHSNEYGNGMTTYQRAISSLSPSSITATPTATMHLLALKGHNNSKPHQGGGDGGHVAVALPLPLHAAYARPCRRGVASTIRQPNVNRSIAMSSATRARSTAGSSMTMTMTKSRMVSSLSSRFTAPYRHYRAITNNIINPSTSTTSVTSMRYGSNGSRSGGIPSIWSSSSLSSLLPWHRSVNVFGHRHLSSPPPPPSSLSSSVASVASTSNSTGAAVVGRASSPLKEWSQLTKFKLSATSALTGLVTYATSKSPPILHFHIYF
jgi:hypothetical protein